MQPFRRSPISASPWILVSLITLGACSGDPVSRLFVKAPPAQACRPDPSIAERCEDWPSPAPTAKDPVERWNGWLSDAKRAHDSCKAAVEEMAAACAEPAITK